MYICGVDIGTTNTKAVLLDEGLDLVDRLSLGVPYPKGTYQLDGSVWYDHFRQAIDYFSGRGHFGRQPVACSITGQGGSFVVLNEAYQPISPAYSWMAQSDPETVRDLESCIGIQRYYRTTGWEPGGWLMAGKVREWRAANPESSAQKIHVATVPESIHARLFGDFVSDITTAQITGMLDFHENAWDPDILTWVGIGKESLPRVMDKLEILREGVRLPGATVTMVTSSHDQYAAMAACGVTPGTVMLGTGSAWVINGKSPAAVFDDRHFMVHPGRDVYGGGFGYITSLGPVGRGLDELLGRLGLDYGRTEAAAGQAGPVRDYMANVAAKVRYILETTGQAATLRRLRMTGGAVKSRVWPQLVANVCNVPVEAVNFEELTAFGAAIWARSAITGDMGPVPWPRGVEVRMYEPLETARYEEWYQNDRRPALAKEPLI